MADSRLVCHEGIVVEIGATDRRVQVKIRSRQECAQCQAKGMCTALKREEKIISVIPVPGESLQIGDTVVVMMEEKLGWKAIFYGFFLPLIVMVATLFFSYALGSSEIAAALYGIGSLLPYYLLLYIFRGKIQKDFLFTAEKKYTLNGNQDEVR